jgi:hypothetical protein
MAAARLVEVQGGAGLRRWSAGHLGLVLAWPPGLKLDSHGLYTDWSCEAEFIGPSLGSNDFEFLESS